MFEDLPFPAGVAKALVCARIETRLELNSGTELRLTAR